MPWGQPVSRPRHYQNCSRRGIQQLLMRRPRVRRSNATRLRWFKPGSSSRTSFVNPLQTKPSMLALCPMQQLRRREIAILQASRGYRNGVLQRLGPHQHHRSARCTKFLFQPLARCPGTAPRPRFAFSACNRRIRIDGTVGKGRAGTALAFQTAARIDAARLAGEDQLDPTAGTCSGSRADFSHWPPPPCRAKRNGTGSLKWQRLASPSALRRADANSMSCKGSPAAE